MSHLSELLGSKIAKHLFKRLTQGNCRFTALQLKLFNVSCMLLQTLLLVVLPVSCDIVRSTLQPGCATNNTPSHTHTQHACKHTSKQANKHPLHKQPLQKMTLLVQLHTTACMAFYGRSLGWQGRMFTQPEKPQSISKSFSSNSRSSSFRAAPSVCCFLHL